ncbi:hypothetical protein [Thiobacillus sp.]
MNCPDKRRRDVRVIDGGHAGSAPALLPYKRRPRFHLGEPLLRSSLALFDRRAVRDGTEAIGMRYYLASPTRIRQRTVMARKLRRMDIHYADKTGCTTCQ